MKTACNSAEWLIMQSPGRLKDIGITQANSLCSACSACWALPVLCRPGEETQCPDCVSIHTDSSDRQADKPSLSRAR